MNKNATINVIDMDHYERSISKVYYNNKYLSAELLKNGLAVVYRKYSNNKYLIKLEKKDKARKIGVCSNPNFITPENFWKLKK